jgi:hypothetical protein
MFIYVSLTIKKLLLVRQSVVVVDDVADVGTFRPKFYVFVSGIFQRHHQRKYG